jgi:hypothetical protein
MLIYVSCDWNDTEKAKIITNELQIDDRQNCYICPILAFSHLTDKDIAEWEKMEICLDLLSVCDMLIVANENTLWESKEVEFANMVGMEVHYL